MGVMSCCRVDCENIMCDTYVDKVGYICRSCQSEFEETFEDGEISEYEFIKELDKFTETSPGGSKTRRSVSGHFDNFTR